MKMASTFGYCSFLPFIVLLLCVYMPIGTMCFTMKIIPRMDMDPILFPKNISEEEKHNRILQLSEIHALSYLVSNTNTITPQTFQPSVQVYGSSAYIVETRIGTPTPYKTYLVLDTGSDDTWLQCDGCSKPDCFPIKYGDFKYRDSETFKEVSCEDPLCVPKKCSSPGKSGKCIYDIKYVDDTITEGIILSENFTFPDPNNKNHPFVSFKEVVFGCGLKNKGFKFGRPMNDENEIGGVFGMGTGPRSILRQLSAETKMRFSYCLNSPLTSQSTHSYLHFGNNAKIDGDLIQKTELLTKYRNIKLRRYYVDCLGIGLNDKVLRKILPQSYQLRPGREGGFVFDSGSAATHLMEKAYKVLKEAVITHFKEEGNLQPYTRRTFGYDLCYLNVPDHVGRPSMTYYFKFGAKLDVEPNTLFLSFPAPEGNILCLTVVPLKNEKLPNILGARHQSDHSFLFDVEKKEISFFRMPHTCI